MDTDLNKVDVWFQDETRAGQQGSITRMWAPKGTRPSAVRQQQFEYVYMFGVACPAQDKALGLVLPLANTQGLIKHLSLKQQKAGMPLWSWTERHGTPTKSNVLTMLLQCLCHRIHQRLIQ